MKDIEGFNPMKKVSTTFSIVQGLTYENKKNGGYSTIVLKCKRYGDVLTFYTLWFPEDRLLMKVGQFPSVADLHIGEIKKYKKLLPKEKLSEFTRAIGLAANGVRIGSFVYLRRIFEYLIKNSYELGVAEKKVNENDFKVARMNEKIALLKPYLPNFFS